MDQVMRYWQNWNDLAYQNLIEDLSAIEEETRQPVSRTRRIVADRMNPFTSMEDGEFIDRFRLRKETVHGIIQDIQDNLPVANDLRGCPVPPSLQVLIAIRCLATGTVQVDIGDCYSVSQKRVSMCLKDVTKAIANLCAIHVNFPEGQTLTQVTEKFYDIAGMPGVIGCIDCTHVALLKPTLDNPELFRCRKGYFSLNVQMVCGPDLTFYNVVARWPGSVHDSRIFENSILCDILEDGRMPGHLLGDSGYSCRNYLLTPLTAPENAHEEAYNKSHIRTRNTVERAFGVLKSRFAYLGKKIRTSLETTKAIIVAAVVLHNIAIKTQTALPDITIQHIDPVNEPQEAPQRNDRRGNLKRQQIIRDYF